MQALDLQWHVGHHDWALDLETDNEPHPSNYDKLVKAKLRDLEKDFRDDGERDLRARGRQGEWSRRDLDLNALSGEIRGNVKAWPTTSCRRRPINTRPSTSRMTMDYFFLRQDLFGSATGIEITGHTELSAEFNWVDGVMFSGRSA